MATQQNAPSFQWNATDGTPAVGFSLYTYMAGTLTLLTTYKDYLASDTNTNPIILDAFGSAQIYISVSAKFILKDLSGATVFTADNLTAVTSNIIDDNGSYLIKFTAATDAIDYITINNAAAGGSPTIGVGGLDVNIDLTLNGKGTGRVVLGESTSDGVLLSGNQPILGSTSNELLKFTNVDSAVNEVTISNNVTASNPIISATGGDTNIGINLQTKGTGSYGLLGTATQRGQLDLYEQTNNGVNKITFRTPAAITTNHALTFDGGGTDRTLTFGGDFATGNTFSQIGAYSAAAAVDFSGAVSAAGVIQLASDFQTIGSFPLALTATGTTNSTLPVGTKTLVPNDITLTAGGLVTGGGDLSANRAFNVTPSGWEEAFYGISSTTVLTPAAAKYSKSAVQAWVSFTSVTTTAILGSYNVTSLTDDGVGRTTVNLTIPMADTLYSATGLAQAVTAGYAVLTRWDVDTRSAGNCSFRCVNSSVALFDSVYQCVHFTGQQAV